jgi:Fic family protein
MIYSPQKMRRFFTMWIYEYEHWPHFTWRAENLSEKLAYVRHKQGRLLGKMERLGLDIRKESSFKTLTNDVIKSTAIEGGHLNMEEVRSSLARRLVLEISGLVPSSRHVDGIVELMLDATESYTKPLTKERLLAWHASLFPTGYSGLRRITVGNWRTEESSPMQVVSGRIGKEQIHFEAAPAGKIDHEITLFLEWFEKNDIDPVLKAGISHFWFVTLHPFDDGNGRIARAICDMALARADETSDRFYSLSSQIESERKD